jgi:hypothetical protein
MSVNGTSHETDIDLDNLYSFWPGNSPAPAPLPEAPASVNCHIQLGGRDCLLTLRDTDETRLLQRLDTVLQRYPLSAAAETSAQPTGELPPCPRGHGFLRRGKHGLYCPKKLPDGTFCPEKGGTR